MSKQLLAAIRKKDIKSVSSLSNQGVDLLYKDEFGQDALFYSVVYPDKEIFDLLFPKLPNIDSSYKENKTILHIAIESDSEDKGFFNIIEAIVLSKIDLNAQDKYGNTPLWYACIYYVVNKRTIDLLIRNGADINIKNIYGSTIYESAKSANRTELLEMIENITSGKE